MRRVRVYELVQDLGDTSYGIVLHSIAAENEVCWWYDHALQFDVFKSNPRIGSTKLLLVSLHDYLRCIQTDVAKRWPCAEQLR